jgi:hypothetical protein
VRIIETHTLWAKCKNVEVLIVRAGGAYSYRLILKDKEIGHWDVDSG